MFFIKKISFLSEKIWVVGLFLIWYGFIMLQGLPIFDGSLRSRVFFNISIELLFSFFLSFFVIVKLFDLDLLWMRVVKRVYLKKIENKFCQKQSLKRFYAQNFFDKCNNNQVACGHKHQTLEIFESDISNNMEIFSQVYEVNKVVFVNKTSSNLKKFNKISFKTVFEKKKIDIKYLNNLDNEIDMIRMSENFLNLKNNIKYFKDVSLFLDFLNEINVNEGVCIKNINLYKDSNKIFGFLISNYTTTLKDSISIIYPNQVNVWPVKKGLNIYDKKFLVITAKNVFELIKMLMFYKQFISDREQSNNIRIYSHHKDFEKFMNDRNLDILKKIGFKNVKILSYLKTHKMGESYLLKKIEDLKKEW